MTAASSADASRTATAFRATTSRSTTRASPTRRARASSSRSTSARCWSSASRQGNHNLQVRVGDVEQTFAELPNRDGIPVWFQCVQDDFNFSGYGFIEFPTTFDYVSGDVMFRGWALRGQQQRRGGGSASSTARSSGRRSTASRARTSKTSTRSSPCARATPAGSSRWTRASWRTRCTG